MAKERGSTPTSCTGASSSAEEFAEAHGVGAAELLPALLRAGDTSEIVKRYIRESVTQVLKEYPDLDGIGISHGEGMGGMTPLERQEWMDEVIIAGMLDADRRSS
jgi:hypothetical protein